MSRLSAKTTVNALSPGAGAAEPGLHHPQHRQIRNRPALLLG